MSDGYLRIDNPTCPTDSLLIVLAAGFSEPNFEVGFDLNYALTQNLNNHTTIIDIFRQRIVQLKREFELSTLVIGEATSDEYFCFGVSG